MKEEGAETVARAIQLNGDTKLRTSSTTSTRWATAAASRQCGERPADAAHSPTPTASAASARRGSRRRKTNAKLASLGLCALGDDGAVALAEALRAHATRVRHRGHRRLRTST